jgi:uncharacterized protein YbaR (Trm112 family)
MIRADLLEILVCPDDQSPLSVASTELIAQLNRAIGRRQLRNRADHVLERPLDGGLIRADRALLYPIVDEIPMMLVDEAIPLDQPALASVAS